MGIPIANILKKLPAFWLRIFSERTGTPARAAIGIEQNKKVKRGWAYARLSQKSALTAILNIQDLIAD